MTNIKLTRKQKALLYLIGRLDELVEGRKKLMKLMFLVEHYDTENRKLTRKQFLGNNFIIYHYGVFSFDVMDDYISLITRNIISEDPIKANIEVDVDEEIRSKVDEIVSKYGEKHGFELEEGTLEMLSLSKKSKTDFFGKDIKEIIK